MKVIVLATFIAVTSAASLTYTTGPVRSRPHSELSVSGIGRVPERVSRVQETVHQESGDALGNREGGFVSRDSEGNVRAVRYATEPRQVYSGYQQQRQNVHGIPASAPARYSYDSEERPLTYRYGSVPRSHSVTFTAPLANTYSHYPQLPYYGNVRRYF